MDRHTSRIAAWDWSQNWNLHINPTKCNFLIIGREVSLRFFLHGSGISIHVSKLVKDLGVYTANVFSLSLFSALAANKARRLI